MVGFSVRLPTLPGRGAAVSGTRSFSTHVVGESSRFVVPQQHSPLAATTVVLSVLQNARSCAEVARAVLGMESREDAAALWRPGRQVLPVQCCGLLAVACKADSARCVFVFCHKWLRDICKHCWVLCFLFTQEQDGDLRFERKAACGWPR
jgi:hypothetical protein